MAALKIAGRKEVPGFRIYNVRPRAREKQPTSARKETARIPGAKASAREEGSTRGARTCPGRAPRPGPGVRPPRAVPRGRTPPRHVAGNTDFHLINSSTSWKTCWNILSWLAPRFFYTDENLSVNNKPPWGTGRPRGSPTEIQGPSLALRPVFLQPVS